MDPTSARAMLFGGPQSWQMETQPMAVRGNRLALSRDSFRDTDEADWPITVETLTLTEITDNESAYCIVIFDPDDIDAAIG